MKTLYVVYAILISLSLILIACAKEVPNEERDVTEYIHTVCIDGVKYIQSKTYTAYVYSAKFDTTSHVERCK